MVGIFYLNRSCLLENHGGNSKLSALYLVFPIAIRKTKKVGI